jgi:hypothetical protein
VVLDAPPAPPLLVVVVGVVVVDVVVVDEPPPLVVDVIVVDCVVVELVEPPSIIRTQSDDKHVSPGSHAPPAVHAQDSLPMEHELALEEEHAVIHEKPIDSANKLVATKCFLSMGTPILRVRGAPKSTPDSYPHHAPVSIHVPLWTSHPPPRARRTHHKVLARP